jgi:hypothetical protein
MSEQLDETSTGNTDTAEATVAAEQPLMRFVWARLDEASQRTPSRLSNYFTRDLEAKRAIVLDHSAVHDLIDVISTSVTRPCECHVLRALAWPYADHPDWQAGWTL